MEAGGDHRAANRRRLVLVAVTEFLQSFENVLMAFGGNRRRFILCERQPRERRRLDRSGLGQRGFFAGNIGRRGGNFLDAKNWLAVVAVEEEAIGGFGALRHRLDLLAIDLHFANNRRTGDVVVPQIVMHALEMPEALAGAGVEGERAI